MPLKRKIRKRYIILIIIALLLFWRYSYFIFTPDAFGSMDPIPQKQALPQIVEGLSVKRDTMNKSQGSSVQYIYPEPFKDRALDKIKTALLPDKFNLAKEVSFSSKEFGWERNFTDYYNNGGVVASNNKYLVILLNRNLKFNLDNYLNVMKGYSGPPPTIYFLYNTAKIGYDDIYVLDRKTGETIKHFRFDDALIKAYYNAADDAFYFRFTDDNTYNRLKLN